MPVKPKIMVVIHGMGDQVRNDSALATAIRFCDHHGYPGIVPLGGFYYPRADEFGRPTPANPEPALFVEFPTEDPAIKKPTGFAEAHWADVARKLSDDSYTLHEAKAWARTIVNRIRVRATQRDPANAHLNYRRIRDVLEEIIEVLGIIETLLVVARKAGLGEFNLKKILDAYLGDVQLVTEFAAVRHDIVTRFTTTLAAVSAKFPDAELHVIAHSEGTVVSFLGLLAALSRPDEHRWIHQVRGYMTFGSPIDKHLALWPEIFDGFAHPAASVRHQIEWINYCDYSDPVGFELDDAKRFLAERGFERALTLKADYLFHRYPVPGAAHVGYWKDSAVFNDFIHRVVNPTSAQSQTYRQEFPKGPESKDWVPVVTKVISYGLPLAVWFGGAYVLVNAFSDYRHPATATGVAGVAPVVPSVAHILRLVAAVGLLVAGTTIWVRLVRLTSAWPAFWKGFGLYSVSVVTFLLVMLKMNPLDLFSAGWLERIAGGAYAWAAFGGVLGSLAIVALAMPYKLPWGNRPAAADDEKPGFIADLGAATRDGRGQKIIIYPSAIVLFGAAIWLHANGPAGQGKLWPLLVAIGVFHYLWWLGSVFFDLIYVWHRYIHGDAAMGFLRTRVSPSTFQSPASQGGESDSPEVYPPSTPDAPTAKVATTPVYPSAERAHAAGPSFARRKRP